MVPYLRRYGYRIYQFVSLEESFDHLQRFYSNFLTLLSRMDQLTKDAGVILSFQADADLTFPAEGIHRFYIIKLQLGLNVDILLILSLIQVCESQALYALSATAKLFFIDR